MRKKFVIERNDQYYSESLGWVNNMQLADIYLNEEDAQCDADELTMSWGTKHTVVKLNAVTTTNENYMYLNSLPYGADFDPEERIVCAANSANEETELYSENLY